jgi:serine protease SohB
MEHLYEILIFAAKLIFTLVFVGALLALVLGLLAKAKHRPQIEIEDINEKFKDISNLIRSMVLSKKALKEHSKAQKKTEKNKLQPDKKIFVLDFEGDIKASQVKELRDEVTALLHVAKPGDEVLIRIESPGGVVHGYGLAAAQIKRFKDAGLTVTASVDKVAASGGYLMACTANKILAAPFAIVGSIGVIAQVPNLHRLLKKNDVDYEEITSGEFKRTVSVLGEITEKGRQKFTEQIEDTHSLFKEFVKIERPQVDLSKIATGEHWFGQRALDLQLVDELCTSDDYLFKNREIAKILRVKFLQKQSFADKLQGVFAKKAAHIYDRYLF